MPTILITGANRGIGKALAESYLHQGWRVIAARRNANTPAPQGAEPVLLDVSDADSITALKADLSGVAIDVLWNNAGVYLDKNQSLAEIDDQQWLQSFQINCMAPVRIAEALIDNVSKSERKIIVFTSSKMGSLTLNGAGAYAYRSSKAALNMAVRCIAQDYASTGTSCLLLHPGHVKTDMGGTEGAIDTTTSVQGMQAVIGRVTAENRQQYNGGYFDYDGTPIPW